MVAAMDGDGVSLDSEAQKLFEQFGGMETWKASNRSGQGSDGLAQSLLEEQKRLDTVRILLIQMAYLISRYMADDSFAHKVDNEARVFQRLAQVITQLAKLAGGHLGGAFIRYRGTPADPQLPEKYDYEIVIGNTSVDCHMAPRIARRSGTQAAKLPDQLIDAFAIFSDYGVNNIFIQIPDHLAEFLPTMQLSLKILSGFKQARQTGAPIVVGTNDKNLNIPLVKDENMFADPNLTLMAGVNHLSQKSMENLVQKVDQWLRKQDKMPAAKRYAGVYNAAIELPKLSAQLKKPPVELNNVKWLITESDKEVVSLEKAYIAQLVMDTAGVTPQKVAKMIKSVYGDDFNKINKIMLGERLNLSSDLLAAVEQRGKEAKFKQEVLVNLQERLDQVKDQVIDEVQVREATGEESKAGKPASPDVVHSQIYGMVEFYKGRSATRKKMVGMVHRPIEFKDRDFEILAKDFHITIKEAQTLVQELKACFAENGHFIRRNFQAAIDHFRQYEQKIFAFLWHHMKDAILPEDRVPFLNSLQTLTAQMNQPKRAFKVLLEDICSDPGKVQFSDNKAVMLANLIVHRPDKALADYEITPEDIVLNRRSLDTMVVEYASWRIEKETETFFAKVNTIHTKLAEALSLGQTSEKQIPASVLLNLERELFIFLSMVACNTGKAILRSAVNEYGDPNANIYNLKESEKFLGGLLQNLRVALRGVGTVGSTNDVALLEVVKSHNEDFQRLKNDRLFRSQARLISEWADEAIKIIRFRS
jgi:hypothetical protein